MSPVLDRYEVGRGKGFSKTSYYGAKNKPNTERFRIYSEIGSLDEADDNDWPILAEYGVGQIPDGCEVCEPPTLFPEGLIDIVDHDANAEGSKLTDAFAALINIAYGQRHQQNKFDTNVANARATLIRYVL